MPHSRSFARTSTSSSGRCGRSSRMHAQAAVAQLATLHRTHLLPVHEVVFVLHVVCGSLSRPVQCGAQGRGD